MIPLLLAIGIGAVSALWLLPLGLLFLYMQAGEGFDGGNTTDDNEHFGHRSHGLDLFDNWPNSPIGSGSDRFVGSAIDSDWLTAGGFSCEPLFKIDGTRMLGAIDMNGNLYEVTTVGADPILTHG